MTVELQVLDLDRVAEPPEATAAEVETRADALRRAGGSVELLALRETGFDSYELVDPSQNVLYWALRRSRDDDPGRFDRVWAAVVGADAEEAVLAQRVTRAAPSGDRRLEEVVTGAVRRVLHIPGPEHPSMLDIVEFFNGPRSQIERLLAEVYPSGAANRATALHAVAQKRRFESVADILAVKTAAKRATAVVSAPKLLEAIVVLRRRGAGLLG